MEENENWLRTKTEIFWGEIAPCEHVVQIYEHDSVFLDALSGFVWGGVHAKDSVVLVATRAHLHALEHRLKGFGASVNKLIAEEKYIPLIAEDVLAKFMVNDWPDESLFFTTVSKLIEKANKKGARVRVFGEMVAILWAQGHYGATVRLEHLWNKFCEQQAFCLFCAYPQSGFTQDINKSLSHICAAHSKVISGVKMGYGEISYKAS
jgi:hypothetical protein